MMTLFIACEQLEIHDKINISTKAGLEIATDTIKKRLKNCC